MGAAIQVLITYRIWQRILFPRDSEAEKENRPVTCLVCVSLPSQGTICFMVPGILPDTLNTVRIRVRTNKLCYEDDRLWSNWSQAMSIGEGTGPRVPRKPARGRSGRSTGGGGGTAFPTSSRGSCNRTAFAVQLQPDHPGLPHTAQLFENPQPKRRHSLSPVLSLCF